MMLPTKLRLPFTCSLRRRLLRVLRSSVSPLSTVELALLCAGGASHARIRVLQQLVWLEECGDVRRLAPLPGGGPGAKQPLRWVPAEGGGR